MRVLRWLRVAAGSVGGWLRQYLRELHVYAGLALVGYGLWGVYEPASWLAVGCALVVLGIRYVRVSEAEGMRER